jgi:hypothetical protein
MISSAPTDLPIGVAFDVRLLVDVSPAAVSYLVPIPVGVLGSAYFPAPLPQFDPAIAGFTVFCQWAILGDPGAQLTVLGLPLAFTDGLIVTLGVF